MCVCECVCMCACVCVCVCVCKNRNNYFLKFVSPVTISFICILFYKLKKKKQQKKQNKSNNFQRHHSLKLDSRILLSTNISLRIALFDVVFPFFL